MEISGPLVVNIQKYSIHDGNGIRTTVFFKGCPLSCLWCHNPETQKFHAQILWDAKRCIRCMRCKNSCEQDAIHETQDGLFTDEAKCVGCGTCCEECYTGARSLAGVYYPPDQLVKKLCQDQMFYETSGGGVTLSGGEVMAQRIEYVEDLMKRLHRRGISVNIDTCGMVSFEAFERILPYTDTFLYDIKCMDRQKHLEYTGGSNQQILQNLCLINERGAKISIRLPLIHSLNDSKEDMDAIISYLKVHQIRPVSIHLLPYHEYGRDKYSKLNNKVQTMQFKAPGEETLKQMIAAFEQEGFCNVKIGG